MESVNRLEAKIFRAIADLRSFAEHKANLEEHAECVAAAIRAEDDLRNALTLIMLARHKIGKAFPPKDEP